MNENVMTRKFHSEDHQVDVTTIDYHSRWWVLEDSVLWWRGSAGTIGTAPKRFEFCGGSRVCKFSLCEVRERFQGQQRTNKWISHTAEYAQHTPASSTFNSRVIGCVGLMFSTSMRSPRALRSRNDARASAVFFPLKVHSLNRSHVRIRLRKRCVKLVS